MYYLTHAVQDKGQGAYLNALSRDNQYNIHTLQFISALVYNDGIYSVIFIPTKAYGTKEEREVVLLSRATPI